MKDSRTFVQPWGFETQVSHQEKEKGKSFSFRETSNGGMIITTAAAVDADEAANTLLGHDDNAEKPLKNEFDNSFKNS